MSARFVGRKVLGALVTLVFVLVFNFFLFRVVENDPVGTLFRGRNLTEEQQRAPVRGVRPRRAAARAVPALRRARPASSTSGSRFETRRARVGRHPGARSGPRCCWSGSRRVLSAVIGTWLGIQAGVAAGQLVRQRLDDARPCSCTRCRTSGSGMLLLGAAGHKLGVVPDGRASTDAGSDATGFAALADQAHHMFLPGADADAGLHRRVRHHHALVAARHHGRGLPRAGPGQGPARRRLVRRRHAVPNALLPVVTLVAINFGFVLGGAIAVETIFSWPGLGQATSQAIRAPDLPMLQGLFLLFSAARDPGQPGGRPALRLPRPARAERPVTATTVRPVRRPAAVGRWLRRRRALAADLGASSGPASRACSGCVDPAGLRGHGAHRPADLRQRRPGGQQHGRATRPGPSPGEFVRWAPTTSGAASPPSSCGAPGSACSSG